MKIVLKISGSKKLKKNLREKKILVKKRGVCSGMNIGWGKRVLYLKKEKNISQNRIFEK